MKLYTFWRSQASYRVRIALALKGMEADLVTVNLLEGEQGDPAYRRINPEMVVPTLIDDDDNRFFQSLAIIDYLDEIRPEPGLLPEAPRDRAYVRAIAHTMVSDAHPLIVPRVRNYLSAGLSADEETVTNWLEHWLDDSTRVVEALLDESPVCGRYCFGDQLTLADICLVPHLTSAFMLYEFDLNRFPNARRIYDECMKLTAFADTHPKKQPGAP